MGGTAKVEVDARLLVEDVTVTFGGLTALDSVSLTVEPNRVVGVIGPNGAGKTTLFNVICGFVRPEHGRLVFGGRELRRHHPRDLAHLGVARTLQGVGLWPGMTVLDNVMAGGTDSARVDVGSALFGLWRSSRSEARLRAKAMDLLARVGVADSAGRYPGELPYGFQKRISIARALMEDPTLLLLDEPASGLSIADMDDLKALLMALRDQMAVLLVEHHMDLVMETCEHLVVLNFGHVIASGTPEVVRANPEVTSAYLGEEVHTGA